MSMPKLKFTIDGREYYLDCLSGLSTFAFSRIALGDGVLVGAPSAQKGLVREVASLPVISTRKTAEQQMVGLLCSYTSGDLPGPFYLRELGIFAVHPVRGEILYAYGNAFDLADYIDPAAGYFEELLSVGAFVGDVELPPSVTLDESLIWATRQGLEEVRAEIGAGIPRVLVGGAERLHELLPGGLLLLPANETTLDDIMEAIQDANAQLTALLDAVDETLLLVNEGEPDEEVPSGDERD